MITGVVIAIEEENGNIVIWVCFTDDGGNEVPFYRGPALCVKEGHNVWPLYATYENFIGRTQEERIEWVRINVEFQACQIIKEKAKVCISGLVDDLLIDLKDFSVSKETCEIPLYKNGSVDKVAIISPDGVFSVAPVSIAEGEVIK